MELRSWQKGFAQQLKEKLGRNKVSLVAMPTGTGKTYIVSSVLKELGLQPFIVAPKIVHTSWKKVLAGFDMEPVSITNWEQVIRGNSPFVRFSSTGTPEWANIPVLVVDEPHKGCSGMDSQAGKCLAMAKAYNFPVIMISATLASSPLQMRNTGFLLGLHNYGFQDYRRWLLECDCKYDTFKKHWRAPKGKRLSALMSSLSVKIQDKIINCKIDDIPDFPKCSISAKLYDMDKRDTEEINAAWADMPTAMKTSGSNDLTVMLRARQRTEFIKCGLLCELVKTQLEAGNSVVVFMNFTDARNRLKTMLSPIPVCEIHGQQSVEERDYEIRKFQENECHVMLAMAQAGGVAVSLHDVKKERPRVSYVNPSFSASEVRQCLGRVWRDGGTAAVQEFPLIAGTIEERVHAVITMKLDAIERLNDADLIGR